MPNRNIFSRPERLPGRPLAAPSWVMPGTLAENCAFLAGMVDEVGLLFMESGACLAYGSDDLPVALAGLPLSYHVHLPLDLPSNDPARVASLCAALLDKTAHLPARGMIGGAMPAVLHPPDHDPADSGLSGRLLAAFAERWLSLGRDPAQLLLENVRGNDLTGLDGQIREYGFGLCLDMGHVLAWRQEKLLRCSGLLQRVELLHVNAPGKGRRAGAHLPLTSLDAAQQRQAARICGSIPPRAAIMLELFSWRHIEESLPLLRAFLGQGFVPEHFQNENALASEGYL